MSDQSTGGTDHCECSEKRRLCGNEACDEKHPEKRFICTRPPGHDGPHSACTPSEHPLEWWGQDDGLRADGGEVEDGIDHCEECGGSIDTTSPNYYKTPDERFKHVVCYEEGGPGDYVLNIAEDYPEKAYVNRQYQCGHTAYGPILELPDRCPHEDCGWFAVSREDRYVTPATDYPRGDGGESH